LVLANLRVLKSHGVLGAGAPPLHNNNKMFANITILYNDEKAFYL